MGVTFRELFLVLDRFRARRERIGAALAPLDDGHSRPLKVALHYRSDHDLALAKLAFQYHDLEELAAIKRRLEDTGFDVIDPVKLPSSRRRRFFSGLAEFPVCVECRELSAALDQLAARLDPALVHPSLLSPENVEIGPTGSSPGAYHHIRPGRDRKATVPGRPWAREDKAPPPPRSKSIAKPPPIPSSIRGKRTAPKNAAPAAVAPPMPEPPPPPLMAHGTRELGGADLAAPPAIELRLRRGDEWVAGRLRYISDRRASVATIASPRVGDTIELSLRCAEDHIEVAGVIDEVTRPSSLSDPVATGFAMSFGDSPGQRRALADFIRSAAARGVKFSPPPPRCARFPLAWSIVVTARRDRPRRVTARDISHGGMFLELGGTPGEQLGFAIPLETAEPVIRGRMRLVRSVSPALALERGFDAGAGAEICTFAAGDSARYDRFVDRIRQRNERSVIVGAAPGRLAALSAALRAVGYSVRSSPHPTGFVELIGAGTQRPDLAVVDHSLSQFGSEIELITGLLGERDVQYLSPRDETVQMVRRRADRLLGIT